MSYIVSYTVLMINMTNRVDEASQAPESFQPPPCVRLNSNTAPDRSPSANLAVCGDTTVHTLCSLSHGDIFTLLTLESMYANPSFVFIISPDIPIQPI